MTSDNNCASLQHYLRKIDIIINKITADHNSKTILLKNGNEKKFSALESHR